MSGSEPRSPCISVCLLDDDEICLGCYRSTDEITGWFMADAEEKQEILDRCRVRMEAASTVRLE